mgnify:CR=1 FL=1
MTSLKRALPEKQGGFYDEKGIKFGFGYADVAGSDRLRRQQRR